MATSYRMGARFEHTVLAKLTKDGWKAMRSAGSHDPADIICWRPNQAHRSLPARIVVLQCKRAGEIGPGDRTEVLRYATGLTAECYVVRSHGPSKHGARVLQVRDLIHWAEGWQPFEDVL